MTMENTLLLSGGSMPSSRRLGGREQKMLDTKILNKMRLALETMASDDRDRHMNAAEMSVFLWSAIQPGITQKELASRVGIAQSETSRIVTQFLSIKGEGYGLLRSEEDPYERRRKIVWLTPKGERVAEKLIELLR